jgi:hypothetical protein
MGLAHISVTLALLLITASNAPATQSGQLSVTGLMVHSYAAHSSGSVRSALVPSAQGVHSQQCCKICRKGKACGDTCISVDKECHVGPGCACDG